MSFSFGAHALIDSQTLSRFVWGVDDASTDVTIGMTAQVKASVELLINSISRQIMNFIALDIKAQSYSEVWDGASSDFLVPRMYPINSIASVKVSANGDWSGAADFSFDAFTDGYQIKFRNMRLPNGRGMIQVVYNAGWSPVPDDIIFATVLQFQWGYKTLGKGDAGMIGVSSMTKGVGGASENITKDSTLGNYGLRSEVVGLLKDYKRFDAPMSVMFGRMS